MAGAGGAMRGETVGRTAVDGRMERVLVGAILLAVAATLAWRLWPLALGGEAPGRQFITEDGYLMLTVARNLGTGLGLSVSDGTIATNGVQPLATLIFALPYALTDGDRVAALPWLYAIWVAVAVAGFLAVRALAARMLAPLEAGPLWPWLAAALWFCGPLLLNHGMNGLETGLYTLLVVLAFLQFARILEQGAAAGTGDLALMGLLLGLAFLGRNDAVFLILGMFLVWLGHGLWVAGLGAGEMVRRAVAPALACAVLAVPWLVHNWWFFGSIVPISGPSQSMSAALGGNLPRLPAVLFEHAFPMLPIPDPLETRAPVIAVSALAVLAVLSGLLALAIRWGGSARIGVVLAFLLFLFGISGYYGLFFGAPYFLSRYTAPLAPMLIIASLASVLWLAGRLWAARAGPVVAGLGTAALVLSVLLLGRGLLSDGVNRYGHFQVVDWVRAHVADDVWVGAVQTGTLGYWHDRTINLDGKVNPAALAARRTEGHVLGYVVESPITYLADWAGIAGWVDRAGFGAHFAVLVEDHDLNLAVLRRR